MFLFSKRKLITKKKTRSERRKCRKKENHLLELTRLVQYLCMWMNNKRLFDMCTTNGWMNNITFIDGIVFLCVRACVSWRMYFSFWHSEFIGAYWNCGTRHTAHIYSYVPNNSAVFEMNEISLLFETFFFSHDGVLCIHWAPTFLISISECFLQAALHSLVILTSFF